MRLTFVGTGDAFGSGGRYNTCLHLAAPGLAWLIDCGASAYLGLRQPNETFIAAYRRVGPAPFKEKLYGAK